MRHRDVQQLLYEYVRGELSGAEAQTVEEHIARCNNCFGELQIVKEAIRILPAPAQKPSDARSEAFWTEFLTTVEEKTRREKVQPVVFHPVWEEIWSIFTLRRPVVLAAAGVVALTIVGISLWMYTPTSRDVDGGSIQVGGIRPDSVRFQLAHYFRTSKMLLVGISNISMESGERLDLSTERQAARKLIQQARYLDTRAPDDRSQQLIRALERILLELANLEREADLLDVEIIRAGIHQENMLFKIRMAESEFSAPENVRTR